MKTIISTFVLVAFFAIAFSQEEPKKRTVVQIPVPHSTISSSGKVNVKYPGCPKDVGDLYVSSCFTNLVNRDLKKILKDRNFNNCEAIVSTLHLMVDKDGIMTLESVEGEDLSDEFKEEIKNAVIELNNLDFGENGKIIAAELMGNQVEVKKSIPFFLHGKTPVPLEVLNVKDEKYQVFQKCNTYIVKDELGFKVLDTIIGDDSYEKYKQERMSMVEEEINKNKKEKSKKVKEEM